MYMAPPFLAYYAADTWNKTLLYESYKQAEYHRAVLQADYISNETINGVWHHIIGPQSEELGLWATGNGWAAGGMTRILATITHAPIAYLCSWRETAIDDLTAWIKEIVDGVMGSELLDGMVNNYMDLDGSIDASRRFGELAGSTMIANVIYRMAVLKPTVFGSEYVEWADAIRATVGSTDSAGLPHVTEEGVITPTVNPLNWFGEVYTAGSPEANSFTVMMYTAWRDCILSGICAVDGGYVEKRGMTARHHAKMHQARSH
jgi:rhamnogalacturonyl hydrolase YesR